MPNPLTELAKLGTSPWFDNISRGLLESGELARLVRDEGLRGVTSNPTIFEKAVSSGSEYDAALERLIAAGRRDPKAVFEALAVDDIRRAADILATVYHQTQGADGFVSLEVSPELAKDTLATVREARRLWGEVARPNLMVKVPATIEGLPAVTQLLGEGININVTLIFSVQRYEAVMDAYLAGLERRAAAGQPLSSLSSVASFFVSRIDSAVDKQLDDLASRESSAEKRAVLEALRGKTAVANAKAAYSRFLAVFSSPRFLALKSKGARVQRPLWASTGTKNPKYSDVLYVDSLIGADTVNTMPPATWKAFLHHGAVRATLAEGTDDAARLLDALGPLGVDLAATTARLEEEGVKAFADSYAALLQCVAQMLHKLAQPAR